jgi:aspartate aminotransferase-like enzyme
MVKAQHCAVLMGTGTLANDVIAGQLSLIPGRGLILSNGEFGERLVDHANRFRLRFDCLRFPWGDPFNRDEIERVLTRDSTIVWLWAVHCETSTGVLNDIGVLNEVCAQRQVRLCMDCISSIGTTPVDLNSVYLASAVSGKGLGSFSGLSMVFHNHNVQPVPHDLPRYLDLGLYASGDSVPFTMSSNLVFALEEALKRFEYGDTLSEIMGLSKWIREQLTKLGYSIVTPEAHASPSVTTIALPEGVNSVEVGCQLDQAGYLLSYNSEYLRIRNWIQVCIMGEVPKDKMLPFIDVFRDLAPSWATQAKQESCQPFTSAADSDQE